MFRYPDKPAIELGRGGLAKLPTGMLMQAKLDGWRCVVENLASGWTFTTRHKKRCPISRECAYQVTEQLAGLPVGTVLDGEWCGRRPGQRGESLWLFDIMQLGNDCQLWPCTTAERWAILQSVVPGWLLAPMWQSGDYTAFFDEIRSDPIYGQLCEGIVLKAATAKYIGSYRECALNPGWFKSKYRAGEDGRTILEPQAATV